MGAALTANPLGEKYAARYGPDFPNQGLGAEQVAEQWGLSRQQLDEFALSSHEKAANAIDDGRFRDQIVSIPIDAATESLNAGIAASVALYQVSTLRVQKDS